MGKTMKIPIGDQTRIEECFSPSYSESLTVFQANNFVRAPKDRLTIIQARLLRFVIGQILKGEKDFHLYEIEIVSLAEHIGMRKNHLYEDISGELISLAGKRIFIPDAKEKPGKKDRGFTVLTWITFARYSDGVVYIRLNDELQQYLFGLYRNFSAYLEKVCKSIAKDIELAVFEYFQSYSEKESPSRIYNGIELEPGEFCVDVEELKDIFLPRDEKGRRVDSYSDNNMFMNRIIKANLIRAYQHTGLDVQYRTKRRKQVDGFHSYMIFSVRNSFGGMIQ